MSEHQPEIMAVLASMQCRDGMCDHDECPTEGAAICSACTSEAVDDMIGEVAYAVPWPCPHRRAEKR